MNRKRLFITAIGLMVLMARVNAQSNIDDAHKFAWGENIGWTNWQDANSAADGVIVGTDFLSGFVWGENVGWINVGNGAGPYANTNDTDFGVNILGNDDLSGFAWGENIGWINFNTAGQAPNQARLDFVAGRFRGYAWGENVGWINLDDAMHFVATVSFEPPTVGDNTCQTAAADTGTPCNTDADCISPAVCGLKSRYVSFTPSNAAVASGASTSIQVEIVTMPQFPGRVGEIWWAGVEQNVPNAPNPALRGAPLVCAPMPTNAQVWTSGVLHLFGTAVVPGSTYNVRMCDPVGADCSDPLLVATGKWGDVIRAFGGGSQPNFADINSIVQKFSNVASAPSMPRADLVGVGNPGLPNTPNQVANFADISNDVNAFSGLPYPFTVPACP